jgi:hypothetical protein
MYGQSESSYTGLVMDLGKVSLGLSLQQIKTPDNLGWGSSVSYSAELLTLAYRLNPKLSIGINAKYLWIEYFEGSGMDDTGFDLGLIYRTNPSMSEDSGSCFSAGIVARDIVSNGFWSNSPHFYLNIPGNSKNYNYIDDQTQFAIVIPAEFTGGISYTTKEIKYIHSLTFTLDIGIILSEYALKGGAEMYITKNILISGGIKRIGNSTYTSYGGGIKLSKNAEINYACYNITLTWPYYDPLSSLQLMSLKVNFE